MDNHSIKGGNILMKNTFNYNKIINITGQIPLWIWNNILTSTMGVSDWWSFILKITFKISYQFTYTLGLKILSYGVVTFCHNTHQALSLNLQSISYLGFQLMAKKAHFDTVVVVLHMMNLPNNTSLQQSSVMSDPELFNRLFNVCYSIY